MRIPNKEIIESLRRQYLIGTRAELVQMDDVQAPPIGTKGTVTGVDDIGSIMVKWDNGSHLNVVYGEDVCRKLNTVITICYGKQDVWDSRSEAREFFLKAIMGSEGSECDRYTKIYAELVIGKAVCTDEEEEHDRTD